MNNKLQKSISLICLGGAFATLTGCASISSEVVYNGKYDKRANNPVEDGIVYYMPKRNIRLNVVVANPAPASGAGSSTSAAPTSITVPPTVIPSGVANSKTIIKTVINVDSSTGQKSASGSNPGKTSDPCSPPAKPDTKTVTVSLANNYATETTPDYSQQFLLDYRKNLFGDNNMAIGINSYGLLSVSHADTVNKFDQIASNIAIDIASASLGAGPAPNDALPASPALSTYANITPGVYTPPSDNSVILTLPTKDTCPIGNYTISIDPTDKKTTNLSVCGVDITIAKAFKPMEHDSIRLCQPADPLDYVRSWWPYPWHRKFQPYKSLSGLFYRQDLPYTVTVTAPEAPLPLKGTSNN